MGIDLLGYSERGIVNALCDDINNADNPQLMLSTFLSWLEFLGVDPSPDFSGIEHAVMLVEQSFSDFGDLDLLILLKCSSKRHAILIEAKVSNDTNSWLTVEDRWEEFLGLLDGRDGSTSNLFVQLHRKVRLVARLREEPPFVADFFVPRGSLGNNQVVSRAKGILQQYIGKEDAWFGAILPDDPDALVSFARETLHLSHLNNIMPTWNPRQWGLLSWQTIADKVNAHDWPRTMATLEWNNGQIFRHSPPVQHLVQAGQSFQFNGRNVCVVAAGMDQHCRVVALDGHDNGFFWKTEKVPVLGLVPNGNPVLVSVKPTLPLSGNTYMWNSQNEMPRLPNVGLAEAVADDTDVVVIGRPSWVTTRVRLKNGSPGTFLVFTHHLQRTPARA